MHRLPHQWWPSRSLLRGCFDVTRCRRRRRIRARDTHRRSGLRRADDQLFGTAGVFLPKRTRRWPGGACVDRGGTQRRFGLARVAGTDRRARATTGGERADAECARGGEYSIGRARGTTEERTDCWHLVAHPAAADASRCWLGRGTGWSTPWRFGGRRRRRHRARRRAGVRSAGDGTRARAGGRARLARVSHEHLVGHRSIARRRTGSCDQPCVERIRSRLGRGARGSKGGDCRTTTRAIAGSFGGATVVESGGRPQRHRCCATSPG